MKFGIDRFSIHKNFNIWKIQMIMLPRREGSIDDVDGKFPDKVSNFDNEEIEGYASVTSTFTLVLCGCILKETKVTMLLDSLYDVILANTEREN